MNSALDEVLREYIDGGGNKEVYREAQSDLAGLVATAKQVTQLREDNKRLHTFASGRGMASEAGSPEEIAILVYGLHDRIAELRAAKDKARTAMSLAAPFPAINAWLAEYPEEGG